VFADRASIRVEAGKGGAGAVSFRREKYVPKGGPDGGDGGKGGSIVFIVDPNVKTLLDFQSAKLFRATPGAPGSSKRSSGKDGKDLKIRVPPASVPTPRPTTARRPVEPNAGSQRRGKGGRQALQDRHQPERAAPIPASRASATLELELKLVADVGLVGFPNAGKSTLISAVSAAKPKVADYPFTTLRPVLGVVRLDDERAFVLEDIPGLIEGASEGKGLGHEFLRHIERTRILAFVIDVTSADPAADRAVLETELAAWSPDFAAR
jgi:GTP-binding protein